MSDWRNSRAARRHLERENAKEPVVLREIPRAEWPLGLAALTNAPIKAWRSRGFLVQAFAAPSPALVRLSVNRASAQGESGWDAEITWDELQRLKREAGYGDCDAIEIYPADRNIVNVANMRHLFVLAEPHPLTWR